MDFKSILEYQKKDGEVIKLERLLSESKNKKISTQMVRVVKEMQVKSSNLEKQAEDTMFEFEKIKKTYQDTTKAIEKVFAQKIENLSEKELDNVNEVIGQITNNLNILEKKLLAQAEKVNTVLNEFEESKKTYGNARNKYNESKKLYDEEAEKIQPQIDVIKKELTALEKGIDPKILEKYKSKKQDRIFPIFVPLADKSCGGCRMEMSYKVLDTIKNNGYIECENCRRIIYLP